MAFRKSEGPGLYLGPESFHRCHSGGVRFIPRLRWLVHTVLLISFTCYWNMQVGISKVAYIDLFSERLVLVCSIYPQPASTYVHCATACTCGLTFQVLSGKTLGMKFLSNM